MSWYPLGRPVGTTIYPAMQMTSVAIFHALKALGIPMTLNDVCCFVPCWFGVSASLLTGLLAYECSGSRSGGAATVLAMAVMPAHLMRSIGGGYDNESIAVTAMVLTFYVWCRSLRTEGSWPIGAAAGLAYTYMVAAWGGYVFVLNMARRAAARRSAGSGSNGAAALSRGLSGFADPAAPRRWASTPRRWCCWAASRRSCTRRTPSSS